ncbi:hypothetical protein [Chitinophaga barathri]|nr:hypothetical protein [Chitinophaga barathri]
MESLRRLLSTKQEIALLTPAITQINTRNHIVRSSGTGAGHYQVKR